MKRQWQARETKRKKLQMAWEVNLYFMIVQMTQLSIARLVIMSVNITVVVLGYIYITKMYNLLPTARVHIFS